MRNIKKQMCNIAARQCAYEMCNEKYSAIWNVQWEVQLLEEQQMCNLKVCNLNMFFFPLMNHGGKGLCILVFLLIFWRKRDFWKQLRQIGNK